MRHIFTSGEILYKENIKALKEGELVAAYLVYDIVEKDTEFLCHGEMNGKKVKVRFVLEQTEIEKIQFKKTVNILMPSDIFHARWASYAIE